MKNNYWKLAALTVVLNVTPVMASEHPAEIPTDKPAVAAPASSAPSATSTQRFADRCTDFTTNGWAFKAPRNFLKWLDAFTDPAIYLEFADRSLDPQSYVRSLSSMLEPAAVRNHLEWSNPEIYNQWAHAAAQPEFYTAVTAIVSDPGRMMRWIMLPLDERAWKLAGKSLNPETWLKWFNAPADPTTQALIAKAADPNTSRLWLEALGDPNNTPWFNFPPAESGEEAAAVPTNWIKPPASGITL